MWLFLGQQFSVLAVQLLADACHAVQGLRHGTLLSASSPPDTRACVLHWKVLWAPQVVENLWLDECVVLTVRHRPTLSAGRTPHHPGSCSNVSLLRNLLQVKRPSQGGREGGGGGGWLSCLLLYLPAHLFTLGRCFCRPAHQCWLLSYPLRLPLKHLCVASHGAGPRGNTLLHLHPLAQSYSERGLRESAAALGAPGIHGGPRNRCGHQEGPVVPMPGCRGKSPNWLNCCQH